MSVFLTPDLRPFFGGTYFPPHEMHGRPGFPQTVQAIDNAWRNRREDVEKHAAELVRMLEQMAGPRGVVSALTINHNFIASLLDRSTADFEPQFGGFGSAPKFPRQTLLELVLVAAADPKLDRSKTSNHRSKVLHTLDAMADGGIRDHLGGGFHRYSTDARWLVPHFEIMLYDNAMLAWVYVEAHRQTGEQRYAAVARGILDFVLREMTSPQGAFYTAFDAEVDAMEGKSYLWTADQIASILGTADAEFFNAVYGVDQGPNFADPHHGSGVPDASILYLPRPIREVAPRLDMTIADLDARLEPMRQKLYAARRTRKQPLLDTKIITSWNALMIRAFAYAGRILQEPRYVAAGAKAADFLLQNHKRRDETLYRTSRDGARKHEGFLDDYAFLIQALLELHHSAPDGRRREEADLLATKMLDRFGEPLCDGLCFTVADAPDLIVRQRVGSDSPLPSGNAVAAMALLELGRPQEARRILGAFAQPMDDYGEGMSAMAQAALIYLLSHPSIHVEPEAQSSRPKPPAGPQELAADALSLQAAWRTPRELVVQLSIADGHHINAHEPAPGLIATTLIGRDSAADALLAVDYPEPHRKRLAFAEQPIPIYNGPTTLVVRFNRDMTGAGLLRFALTYQACTDQSCLPPITAEFEVGTP